MFKRLLIMGLGTSMIQVTLYILLLHAGSVILDALDKPQHKGVDWGLTLQFAFFLFSALVLVLNIVIALINKKSLISPALSLVSLVYVAFWAEDFDTYPYRTLYLLTVALICLWTKLLIVQRLERVCQQAKIQI